MALISPPQQKALPPAPLMTTLLISVSISQASSARAISRTISRFSALRAFGRLSVMTPQEPNFLQMISGSLILPPMPEALDLQGPFRQRGEKAGEESDPPTLLYLLQAG